MEWDCPRWTPCRQWLSMAPSRSEFPAMQARMQYESSEFDRQPRKSIFFWNAQYLILVAVKKYIDYFNNYSWTRHDDLLERVEHWGSVVSDVVAVEVFVAFYPTICARERDFTRWFGEPVSKAKKCSTQWIIRSSASNTIQINRPQVSEKSFKEIKF